MFDFSSWLHRVLAGVRFHRLSSRRKPAHRPAPAGRRQRFQLDILEDRLAPATGVLEFFSSAITVAENTNPQMGIRLTTTNGPITGSVTVQVSATAGTAQSGSDFNFTTQTVTFNLLDRVSGSGGVGTYVYEDSVAAGIVNNSTVEDLETYTLTLSNINQGSNTITLGGNSSRVITIDDNDVATYTVGNVTRNESQGTMTFTVQLSNAVDIETKIDVSFEDITTNADDFDHTPVTVTFPANSTTSQTVVLNINDTVVEAQETFTVKLAMNPSIVMGAREFDVSDTATGTINDNDYAVVSIASGSDTLTEGAAGVDVPVTLTIFADGVEGTGTLGTEVVVDLIGAADIATTSAAFAPGSISGATANIAVAALNDNLVEDLVELVSGQALSVSNANGANVTAPGAETRSFTIIDDDRAVITFSGSTTVSEGGSGTADILASIALVVSDGGTGPTAIAPGVNIGASFTSPTGDFTATSVSWNSTDVIFTKPVGVNAIDDRKIELSTEVLSGLLTASNSARTEVAGTATVNVVDNDSVTISIAGGTTAVEEGGDTANVTATLTLNTQGSGPIELEYAVSANLPGNADYSSTGVTFAAGSANGATADIVVSGTADDIVEETEEFVGELLAITNSNGVSASATGSETIQVTNTTTAEVSVSATIAEVTEGETGQFTVSLTKESTTNTEVFYTISGSADGSDHTLVSGSVIIPANELSVTIDVPTIDDDLVEETESVVITLDSVSGNPLITLSSTVTASVDILDNDSAEVSVSASIDEVTEGDSGQFTVSLTKASSTDTEVFYTITGTADGSDHTLVSGSVIIPANELSATIDVPTIDDDLVEETESVVITLDSVSGDPEITLSSTVTASVDILDNDSAEVSVSATIDEVTEGDSGQFTVSLTKASSTDTEVFYTITGTADGSDHTLVSGSVIIPANELSVTIDVPTIDDNLVEATETVVITLDSVSGDPEITLSSTVTASVDILDNDTAEVSVSAATSEVDEPSTNGKFTVTMSNPSSTATTVNFSVSGSAASGDDFTSLGVSVVIPANTLSVDIPLTVLGDSLVEGNETVIVTLDSTDNGQITVGSPAAATITIIDAANQEPSGEDNTIELAEDSFHAFSQADFGFSDPDGDDLLSVTIVTLPTSGTLFLDGAPITAGTVVAAADLDDFKLVYVPAANLSGSTSFTFQVQDDGGTTNGGTDIDATPNTITLNVLAVNDAPFRETVNIHPLKVAVNSANTSSASLGIPSNLRYYRGGGADESTQVVTIKVIAVPAHIQVFKADGSRVNPGRILTLTELRTLRFKTIAGRSGAGEIRWSVTDDGGTANGGQNSMVDSKLVVVGTQLSAPVRVSKALTPINVLKNSANTTALSFALAGINGVGYSAVDAGQTFNITIAQIPAFINVFRADGTTPVNVGDTLSIADFRTLTFKTVPNASGTGRFEWNVIDTGANNNTLLDGIDMTVFPNED